ncbi:MAG: protoporphyrinogen oxidase [Dehalococcoidales bacterium]|nr:protoporphyrinogen oxidase [Dehalococcoidales bacterium]
MSKNVLVTYGTKYGATGEIAEKIGETLKKEGLQADVCSAGKVGDIAKYDAFVIGSAVYIGMWQKDAVKFVQNNLDLLMKKPVWIFSSGPTGDGDIQTLMAGWEYPNKLKHAFAQIKPRGNGLFHGAADPEKLNFLYKWTLKNVKAPTGDFRKWPEIEAWAKAIAAELKK